ncbi:Unknown protein sequence [Pseudomonas savastanoi pv. phaseolicola]|uniref:Uncharacterized protein n=2 Tax=Pseudomonas savastanoi TaxID=29438 RepID=A0A3M4MUA2_PSESG|nr:Unknown protein sequence [Pseudomonas savastanoi pv. phaseolicola]KPB74834.1 Unknown protein sequence [Pseudomonas amygdali pv. mellea]RMM62474.1 hypothetical protein ALQ74_02975 [Pseudomonas savastanoi pv. glycinea]KPB46514.1 Unknown protein sequence [Pseudomonas savastanoi pv. phaseolicola]KPB68211.1 Unknown protein sequence [Pseudomonas savastanoi pv. phaseolicola]
MLVLAKANELNPASIPSRDLIRESSRLKNFFLSSVSLNASPVKDSAR